MNAKYHEAEPESRVKKEKIDMDLFSRTDNGIMEVDYGGGRKYAVSYQSSSFTT